MKYTKVEAPACDLNCPGCGAPLTGVAHPNDDEQPSPGDLSVCVYCAQLMRFTKTLGLESLSEDELKKLPEESQKELKRAEAACMRPKAMYGGRNQTHCGICGDRTRPGRLHTCTKLLN